MPQPREPEPAALRHRLRAIAPQSTAVLEALAEPLVAPALDNLERQARGRRPFPKVFNDPVWGTIRLYPWEVALLDSPLMQRLRGIRQLGMAHLVYPGATHERLSHCLGVLEAAERMTVALSQNAALRRRFGDPEAAELPEPSALDQQSVRLGGLLHDIGHGPFSHASEPYLGRRLPADFSALCAELRAAFGTSGEPSPGEAIAAMFILSAPMQAVLAHPAFEAAERERLAPAVAARILGSDRWLDADWLAGVISGPIDADKLDYMARDSHHSGLPLGVDIDHLIAKLEVVTVTARNAPEPGLARAAAAAPGGRLHRIGLAPAGLAAYEQLVVGRVLLYDRIYFHHKVRAAEAMMRRMLSRAAEAGLEQAEPRVLLSELSDDTLLAFVARADAGESPPPAARRAAALARAVSRRQLHHRAFAFAPRFMAEAGPDGAEARWQSLLDALLDDDRRRAAEAEIEEKARALAGLIPELASAAALEPGEVLIDIPVGRVAVPSPLLTRTRGERLAPARIHFDPVHWSDAHRRTRLRGHVFAPAAHVPAVAMAAQIVFAEVFQTVVTREAHQYCKTDGLLPAEWFSRAADAGLCSQVRAAALGS